MQRHRECSKARPGRVEPCASFSCHSRPAVRIDGISWKSSRRRTPGNADHEGEAASELGRSRTGHRRGANAAPSSRKSAAKRGDGARVDGRRRHTSAMKVSPHSVACLLTQRAPTALMNRHSMATYLRYQQPQAAGQASPADSASHAANPRVTPGLLNSSAELVLPPSATPREGDVNSSGFVGRPPASGLRVCVSMSGVAYAKMLHVLCAQPLQAVTCRASLLFWSPTPGGNSATGIPMPPSWCQYADVEDPPAPSLSPPSSLTRHPPLLHPQAPPRASAAELTQAIPLFALALPPAARKPLLAATCALMRGKFIFIRVS